MRFIALILALLLAVLPASAQLSLTAVGGGFGPSGGGTSVALDGHATNHTTVSTCTLTPTTAGTNRIIVVEGFALSSGSSTGSIAVTDNLNGGGGLTWNSRFSANDNAKSVWNYVFWAVASSQITSGTITVTETITGFGAYHSCEEFGVSGAHNAAPFDTQGGTVYASATTAAITPVTSKDFVFGLGSCTGSQSGVSPWTLMDDNITTGALLAEYQLPAGGGTFTYNFGGCTIFGGSLVDAIIPGP